MVIFQFAMLVHQRVMLGSSVSHFVFYPGWAGECAPQWGETGRNGRVKRLRKARILLKRPQALGWDHVFWYLWKKNISCVCQVSGRYYLCLFMAHGSKVEKTLGSCRGWIVEFLEFLELFFPVPKARKCSTSRVLHLQSVWSHHWLKPSTFTVCTLW